MIWCLPIFFQVLIDRMVLKSLIVIYSIYYFHGWDYTRYCIATVAYNAKRSICPDNWIAIEHIGIIYMIIIGILVIDVDTINMESMGLMLI